jgi:hypothetical protein
MRLYPVVFALALVSCSAPEFAVRAEAPAPLDAPGAHALAVVRIHAPWYAPRFVIAGRFRDAVPEYEAIAPLESKYFTISDNREFGGIYVWKTREEAETYFDDAWYRGVRARRGVEPNVLVLDAPILFRGRTTIKAAPIGARSVDYPATATLVLWSADAPELDRARRLAELVKDADGLLRGAAVTSPGKVGYIALWASRDLAEAALASRESTEREIGLRAASVTLFDAPVLIDSTLR